VGRLVAELVRVRDEKGWSVQQLSDASGVGYETIRTLLGPPKPGRNRQGPSFFVVADVAAALKVPLPKLDRAAR